MASTLKPVKAVWCPSVDHLVPIDKCEECPSVIEVRRPWRHFAVRCRIGGKNEGVYL